ncbi:hypothetical protein ACFLXW_00485 [Candidatus Dependentiae bacterium]
MRREQSDISLLLMVLVLFSASIGLLHGFKISLISASDTQSVSLSEQDMFDMIFPQLISDNIDKAAVTLQQFDFPAQLKVLQQVIKGDGIALSDIQKIMLIGALASYAQDITQKAALFTLLRSTFSDKPVLALIAVQYPDIVGSLIEWAKKDRKKEKEFKKWRYASIAYTLAQNNVALLTDLYTQGLRLEPREAAIVLDKVVAGKRNVGFVPLLVRQFGAQVDGSDDGMRTVLIKAVEENNKDMVRALLAVGANPKYVQHESVGSALSIAIKNGLHEIESILRDY